MNVFVYIYFVKECVYVCDFIYLEYIVVLYMYNLAVRCLPGSVRRFIHILLGCARFKSLDIFVVLVVVMLAQFADAADSVYLKTFKNCVFLRQFY